MDDIRCLQPEKCLQLLRLVTFHGQLKQMCRIIKVFFVVRNPTALRNAKGQRNGNPLIPFAITFYNEWG